MRMRDTGQHKTSFFHMKEEQTKKNDVQSTTRVHASQLSVCPSPVPPASHARKFKVCACPVHL